MTTKKTTKMTTYMNEMDKIIVKDWGIPEKLMKMLDVACKHNLKSKTKHK